MNLKQTKHLYWRAGFGLSVDEYQKIKNWSKKEVVSHLFNSSATSTPFNLDLSELKDMLVTKRKTLKKVDRERKKELQELSREKLIDLNNLWIEHMSNGPELLREKMTLFWFRTFICKDNNIFYFQKYLNTIKNHALGNFKDLVVAISKEPSMLKYLNNRQNKKQKPNENFARELMELFTLGTGHYTEKDIKESARAFTGWGFKMNGDFKLYKFQHDYGEKTFFGKTGNFDGTDIIDLILEKKACARFICEKVYKYFISDQINESFLKQMTDLFYKDYNISHLMQFVFESEFFYAEENQNIKIKSPIELIVGIKKVIPFKLLKPKQMMFLQKIMGQALNYPPNVAGWEGGQSWIDSNTLVFRLRLASTLVNNAHIEVEEKKAFESTFEEYYGFGKKKQRFLKIEHDWNHFFDAYKDFDNKELKEFLLISKTSPAAEEVCKQLKETNKRDYIIQLMSLPEYQLC